MKKLVDNINNAIVELFFNEDFKVHNSGMKLPEKISSDFIKETDFNEIYALINGAELQWTNLKNNVTGSFKVQSSIDFISDGWDDMVDEIEGNIDCDIDSFRVFDFFSNQEYVGCFLNNYNEIGLFYVRETTAYPLYISATSYLELLQETMGIMHWPSLLVKLNLNIELLESKDIETNISKTFPNLNLEDFKNKYLNLRLNI